MIDLILAREPPPGQTGGGAAGAALRAALAGMKTSQLRKRCAAAGVSEEDLEEAEAVLQDMKGPPAELTKLLGEGLDAEEILRS